MPHADVRAAIVAYLNSLTIPNVVRWYRDQPWFISGDTWQFEANADAAAIGVVHIDESTETRITLPAGSGQKEIVYTVSLLILYQYRIPTNVPQGNEDDWVDTIDQVLDDVMQAIRASPTAGTAASSIGSGMVFQWGQDHNAIRVMRDLPRRVKGSIMTWNRIEITDVTQIITA